jgi:PAT family beta-lactamase induction signal transducer AmpG
MRSTFYRTATIVGSGLLVVLAGVLESRNGLPPIEITIGGSRLSLKSHRTTNAEDRLEARVAIPIAKRPSAQTEDIIQLARKFNRADGYGQEITDAQIRDKGTLPAIGAIWARFVTRPLKSFLATHFPKPAVSDTPNAGDVCVIELTLSRQPDRDVIVSIEPKKTGIQYLGFAKGDKGVRLIEGERFVFNSTNWNKPARAVFHRDPKLKEVSEATFTASSGNIPLAWTITLAVVAGLFLAFSCWHSMMLPRPSGDGPVVTHRSLTGEFFSTLGSFFKKPGAPLALAFILLYRFDEAQLGKVISPFMLDSRSAGGLALATSQVGLAYGTFGILALTCGGLLGGFLAARYGLKTMLPIMVCAQYLPKLAFVFLSFVQPENFLAVCGVVAIEQFGYGFGFTAFMLYLLYFADGPHKTAHYALCTGFMALGMMIPGLWSGWLTEIIGYKHFFVWVICSALPGFTLAMVL